MLKSVYNIIKVGGKVGVIHWNYEKIPRGPSMDIRPKAENIIEWSLKAGFRLEDQFEFPPYHYGLVYVK